LSEDREEIAASREKSLAASSAALNRSLLIYIEQKYGGCPCMVV